MDFGWLGQNTLPIEHLASQQAVEIGARTYLPVLGRFLQTDPVSGGSSNDYDYVNADPINNIDLTGKNPLAVIAPLVPEIGEGLGAVLAPEIVIPAVVLGAGIYAIEKANDHKNDSPATSKPNTAQAPDKAATPFPKTAEEPGPKYDYRDRTNSKSSTENRGTSMTRPDFEGELRNQGWKEAPVKMAT
ncbi:RHS repeat-associated protein [Nocardia sp. GAS34]|uniref:RHS repeat-associated core domain-containing protein n=1 Tax=unclassified Nocardia TaxID=2637762 RepID=UPI003D261516